MRGQGGADQDDGGNRVGDSPSFPSLLGPGTERRVIGAWNARRSAVRRSAAKAGRLAAGDLFFDGARDW